MNQMTDNLNTTGDYTSSFHPQDIAQNKIMGILSYICILVLVPVFAATNSPYSKFHANQGLLLLIGEAAVALVFGLLGLIPAIGVIFRILLWICELCFASLSLVGLVYAINGKAKELPFIGKIYLLK